VQSTLSSVGSRLVDIHSQTDHLAILRPAAHVNYLDRYAGTAGERAELAAAVAEWRDLTSELERLHQDARERLRRQERLAYETQEIEAARLDPREEDVLRADRRRLANAEQLSQLAAEAYVALEGDGEAVGAADSVGQAADLVAQLARLDESLSEEASQLGGLQSQLTELSRTIRAYAEQVEFSPERLQEIELRLELLSGLKRKYGASVEEVIAYGSEAARELEALMGSEERIDALTERQAELARALGEQASELSSRRRRAAERLSLQVEQQLSDLGLGGGRFGVRFELRPEAQGIPVNLKPATITSDPDARPQDEGQVPVAIDRTGVDRVEFVVSLNPGEPLRPLARIASGGEISRLMLALKTILGDADDVPTLVFDEVDVGVGGRSGGIVGDKLAALAKHHQVICVTHLPQIAALAQCHLAIEKQIEEGQTRVLARQLNGEERVLEVAAMLGGVTSANRASAQELLGDTSC
jgi:DNA repair protein RecN (Recombination protein N)